MDVFYVYCTRRRGTVAPYHYHYILYVIVVVAAIVFFILRLLNAVGRPSNDHTRYYRYNTQVPPIATIHTVVIVCAAAAFCAHDERRVTLRASFR